MSDPENQPPAALAAPTGYGLPSVHGLLRHRLEAAAGIMDRPQRVLNLRDLERSEWSPRFERLMRNRLVMGALRYGLIHARQKRPYNRVAGARKRLAQYADTGNLECLVDVANMALLEFEEGRHPTRHWGDIHGDHCCA